MIVVSLNLLEADGQFAYFFLRGGYIYSQIHNISEFIYPIILKDNDEFGRKG